MRTVWAIWLGSVGVSFLALQATAIVRHDTMLTHLVREITHDDKRIIFLLGVFAMWAAQHFWGE